MIPPAASTPFRRSCCSITRPPTSASLSNNFVRSARADQSKISSFCAWTMWNLQNPIGQAVIAGAMRINRTRDIALDGTKILTNFEKYMGSNTRMVPPNMVNEARYGYTRFSQFDWNFSWCFNTDVVSQIGIPGLNPGGHPVQWGIPNVTLNQLLRVLVTPQRAVRERQQYAATGGQFVDASTANTRSALAANSSRTITTR